MTDKPHVHELVVEGLPHVPGRQWFALDAVPDVHKNYIGECLIFTTDQKVRLATRHPNGMLEHEPLASGVEVKFWTLKPDPLPPQPTQSW